MECKVIKIYSEVPKHLVAERLGTGKISGCGAVVPTLQQSDIDDCRLIVAQIGPEPYIRAMQDHPDFDVIIGGRAYDPAPYVAFTTACMRKRNPKYITNGLFDGAGMQAGKILECGGTCAVPKSHGAVSTIYTDGTFDIAPTLPGAICTALSVAAHTLYEKSRPDLLHGPGGWLDLRQSKYAQQPDGRTVRVKGSTFHTSRDNDKPYQVKLEAARTRGFRSMYMGRHVDRECCSSHFQLLLTCIAALTEQIDILQPRIRAYVRQQLKDGDKQWWDLSWHIHGQTDGPGPKSLFIIGESIAETQELASSVAGLARVASIHGSYPGQKATGGNLAWGIGGVGEIPLGPCSEFCIYHLMDLNPGEEVSLFPTSCQTFDFTSSDNESVADEVMALHINSKQEKKDNNGHSAQFAVARTDISGNTLGDLAKVLRSKNSGPYEITIDVMFDNAAVFEKIKRSGMLTEQLIASLYNIKVEEVIWCGFFKQALAFKATIPRIRDGAMRAGGGFMEDDIHGSQQYMPLKGLKLPQSLLDEIAAL